MVTPRKRWSVENASWDRFYIGHEFCERLVPDRGDIERVLEAVGDRGRRTLVTPYVADRALTRIETLARRFLTDDSVFDEIVINDWGVYHLLRDYPVRRVLGRLLVRQLRDPRVIADRRRNDALRTASDELSVSAPFLTFLLEAGFDRIEVDTLPSNLPAVADKIHVSLYRPYTYITTTRLCPVANLSTRPDNVLPVARSCRYECVDTTYRLEDRELDRPLYLDGNTIFFRNPDTDRSGPFEGIDRVIEQGMP